MALASAVKIELVDERQRVAARCPKTAPRGESLVEIFLVVLYRIGLESVTLTTRPTQEKKRVIPNYMLPC